MESPGRPSPEITLGPHATSQSEERFIALASFFRRALASPPVWWGICLGCAAILAFSARYSMNEDGLSYLDLASEALHRGPSALLNGYWSPGYPALLSLALAAFHPSPRQEFPLVHFVNFLIFALTLWAFHFFLKGWLSHTHASEPINDRDKTEIVPFAFCTFLWFMLKQIGVELVVPDLCVAATVFLASGIACRLSLPGPSSKRCKRYVALGLTLGLGYYAKAPMFPLGLALLGWLFLQPPSHSVTRRGLLLSLSVFLLTASPLVTALSGRAGRLSFGESGRLNYAWYVDSLQIDIGWMGGSPEAYGVPEHPPRRLMEKPLILEFGSPVKGTFPLWYDPSYWYAGAKVHFGLRQQIAALRETLGDYKGIIDQTAAFFSGAIVLCILAAREKRFPNLSPRSLWMLSWPLTAVLMYALVHVESRFVAAFFALVWLAIYGALSRRLNSRAVVAVCATVVGAVMIPFIGQLTAETARAAKDVVFSRQPDYQMVADGLRDLGVQSGDCLAVVGYPFDPYYARYARLRVIAQIPAPDELWGLGSQELKSVTERLRQIGVKAVVAKNRPDIPTQANWRDVRVSKSERFSLLLLSEPLSENPPK
jgi:hypothetical protein